MKIGLITDTHFSFRKSNKNYHDYFERFYTEVFFPTLGTRRIDTVIHLGDAYDNRKGIDYWGLEWSYRVFYDKLHSNGIQLIQILGNHDSEKKTTNKYNSIDTLLRDYSNIKRITEVEEYRIGNTKYLFVPWICKDNEEKTFELIRSTDAKVVFGHLELTGFTLYPGCIQTNGLSKDVFNKFDRVFSGHYHTRSNDGRVFYLGNPYQMFWSDVNDSRGFSIFDTDTYELEFIENPFEIYYKINYNDTDHTQFDFSQLENKNVKIIVQNKTNQSQYDLFVNQVLKCNILDLKIMENMEIDTDLVDISECDGEDTLTILNKYIEQSDFKLKKNVVQSILYETYQEALTVEM